MEVLWQIIQIQDVNLKKTFFITLKQLFWGIFVFVNDTFDVDLWFERWKQHSEIKNDLESVYSAF